MRDKGPTPGELGGGLRGGDNISGNGANASPGSRKNIVAKFAKRYCEIGLALTFTLPGAKGPRHAGWNLADNAITEPNRAFGYWLVYPTHGIAALLGPSGLVSLDIDDEQYSPRVLQH